MMVKVLIIGGSNIDYFGKSFHSVKLHDSNIGKIKISFGGVARNICENLARLGVDVNFISAIGNDDLGKALVSELRSLNVNVINPQTDLSSSSYMAIHDLDGDMMLALCDDEIIETINPNFIETYDYLIKEFEYIVLDTNLSQEAINYLFNKYQDKKILVDGISTTKVMKLSKFLNHIYLLKCNIYEAQTLVNDKLNGESLLQALKNLGLKNVVVTQGKENIYYLDEGVMKSSPVEEVDKVINATGAGDAMLAGITFGLINGKKLSEALEYGKKLSSITLKTDDAVYKKLTKNIFINKKDTF